MISLSWHVIKIAIIHGVAAGGDGFAIQLLLSGEATSGLQKFLEGSLSLTGVLISYCHSKCFPGTDKNSEFPGSGQSSINKIPKEHFEVLCENRNNNRLKFTPL